MMENESCCKSINWTKVIGILAMCAIIIVAILRDRIVNERFKQITATGQGKITYTPDTAVINLGVQVDRAPKAEDALNQLNDRIDKIKKAVMAVGVKEEDITTSNYSLSPQYDYRVETAVTPRALAPTKDLAVSSDGGVGSSEIAPMIAPASPGEKVLTVIGYTANQQLTIKVKDIANNNNLLNKAIAEAGKSGANQINGVSFEASNLEALKQQGRVKAIEDAKGKAKELAGAAGVRLGDITGWYENFVGPTPYGAMDYAAKGGMGGGGGSVPQISAGNNELVVEVGVTYDIKN
jgi:hypothetical protein